MFYERADCYIWLFIIIPDRIWFVCFVPATSLMLIAPVFYYRTFKAGREGIDMLNVTIPDNCVRGEALTRYWPLSFIYVADIQARNIDYHRHAMAACNKADALDDGSVFW